MAYIPHPLQFSLAAVIEYWHDWRSACDRSITHYYNQRIELDPEGEAQQYWCRIRHPHSSVNVYQVTDAMLSRFMQKLIDQGISKFAVDRFILELRRQVRSVQPPVI